MELSALVSMQLEADERRGFSRRIKDERDRQRQLADDLVGLVGEIGEFANLLKKVGLALDVEGYEAPTIADASAQLSEELADAAIYIFRLSAALGCDLEKALLRKMSINDERYRDLERK
jgi:NTP pyrophosphatase (non-canonical NTP hydrolase)